MDKVNKYGGLGKVGLDYEKKKVENPYGGDSEEEDEY